MTIQVPAQQKATVSPVRHDRVRLTVLLARKKGMSVDDFRRHWRETHAGLFTDLPIVKKNVLKYEQVRLRAPAMASRSVSQ